METKIDLEFLKNRLKRHEQSVEIEASSEVSSFLSQFNIQKGTDKIETFIIKALYNKFIASRVMKLSYIDFSRKLCKYIDTVRWGKQRYYLVDRSVMLLSTDDELNMRIHESIRKKEFNLRKKKRS